MVAGYSGKPLAQKLGIKRGARLLLDGAPDHYWHLIGQLPEGVAVVDADHGSVDVVHLFVRDKANLADRLRLLRRQVVPDGMIWVSWPKRSSGVATDLSENGIREAALAVGLVDVKVCAIDETWSGLKLVVRVKDRAGLIR